MELTLFLPTCAAFLMVVFTIFSFARTRSEVSIESRHTAWVKRSDISSATSLSGLDARGTEQILVGTPDPAKGLVTARTEKDATIYLKTLNLLTNLQSEHAVLTDSWDFETIPFEDHSHLTMDRRVAAFSASPNAFSTLGTFGGGNAATAAGLNSSRNSQRNQARNRMNAEISDIRDKIDRIEDRIDDLRDRLRNLYSADPVDTDAVRETGSRLRRERRELRKYQQQQGILKKGIARLDPSIRAATDDAEQ